MKGKIYKGNIIQKQDELTGVKVTRLTDDSCDTIHPYFTHQIIDSENKTVLALSMISGSHQLYTLDIENGDMVQLTDQKDGKRINNPILDITNNIVYYFIDRTLKRIRLDNLEEESLLELPKGFHLGNMSITNKGDFLAITYTEDLEVITKSNVIYSDMQERLMRHPLSVVCRYEVANGKLQAVWGEHQLISHTNISYVDPNYILFCHEGSWVLVQRMWVAKVDTNEVKPLIVQKYNHERVGHEFITASGRVGAQYSFRVRPDLPYALQADIYVNPDGTDERRFYYPYGSPNHIQMNYAETMGAGDRAQIKRDMPDFGKYMGLMKYIKDEQRIIVGLLCKHDSSWLTQNSHPHPVFTRDDKHVIYTSDAGGRCNIYKAEANWEKCLKSE